MAFKFLPLFLVLVCMKYDVLFISGEVRCMAKERRALLTFKQGLMDDYGVLSSWGSQDHKKECCNWNGVLCSNITDNVIGLQLNGDRNHRQLRGKISPALLELHHLNNLDLSSNDFGGMRIPDFIGSMKMLQHLSLSQSNFHGMVPHELGNLTNLKTLDLSHNSLRFENLNWVSHLSLLSRLVLTGSNISDSYWLQQILKLRSLQELYLQHCHITEVTSSTDLFINSSMSLSTLHLSKSWFTSSVYGWLFNISTSLVSIDLSQNQLDGPIPDGFGKLILLEHLDLSDNKLEDGIPKSLGNLSYLQSLLLAKNSLDEPVAELFGNLCCRVLGSLETIDWSGNQLVGSVPDLRSFIALRELYLGRNRLTGSLPSTFGQLPRLEILDVSYNSLVGTISEAHFMKLHNLKLLALSFNALMMNVTRDWIPPFQLDAIHLASCIMGPNFPTWLQTQNSFSSVDLSRAGISDEVPKWFWDLSPRLNYLNLSINNISGEIPDLSSKFDSSSLIDISFNAFSGPIPLLHPKSIILQMSHNLLHGSISSICTILSHVLLLLDLSYNQLSGELPNCWANMGGLFILSLANNQFSGEIPPSLSSLSQLETLILRHNNFSGELPYALSKWQNLRIVDVGGNQLTGNIPAWIGTYCPNLIYFSIQQNRFHGSIPPQLCLLSKIQILDLSRNSISGRIPQCFNNFTFLAQKTRTNESSITIFSYKHSYYTDDLYIATVKVQFKGKELEYNKTLGLLKLLDLSSNRIVGHIPRELFTLKGLISLNLSRNSLSGNIDPDVSEMEMLESLDLSRNQLSGVIPGGLAQLSYLQVLDLANNNLSGKIPTSTQLQSFNASVYAGNSDLCGNPLPLCPSDGLSPSNTHEGEHEGTEGKRNGFMSLSFLQDFGMSMAFGFIFGFWGVVGSFLLKKSWRIAYFNLLDDTGDWLNVKTTIVLAKFKRS